MTIEHISHYGLTEINRTDDSIVFEGGKADCLRMAFAHGLEIVKYEGRIVSTDCGRAICEPADASNWAWCWLTRGMIHKGRDSYVLIMPMEVWTDN